MPDFMIGKSRSRSDEKREFYKLILARSDLTAALSACELFIREVDEVGHQLYYPLSCSIVVCYARPFSKNKPFGPLAGSWRKFGTSQLQQVHDELIRARNELMAHSDLNARTVQIVSPGCRLGKSEMFSSGLGTSTSSFFFKIGRFPAIRETVIDLGRRLDSEIELRLDRLYARMDLPKRAFNLRFDEGL